MALITFFHMYSISSVMQMVTGRIYMGSEEKRAFLIACSIFIHYDVTDQVLKHSVISELVYTIRVPNRVWLFHAIVLCYTVQSHFAHVNCFQKSISSKNTRSNINHLYYSSITYQIVSTRCTISHKAHVWISRGIYYSTRRPRDSMSTKTMQRILIGK